MTLLAGSGPAAAQNTVIGQIRSGGVLRDYRLYVPAAYRSGTRVPLLLNLHALSADNITQENYGDFRPIADTANFLVLHPNGLPNSNGQRHWDVFDEPAAGDINDVAFLAALIDTICQRYSVDANRIYSTGMSNGGFMSYELACQLSGRIAAIASVAGSQNPARLAACAPRHPTPVLVVHGTADNGVPYEGTAHGYMGNSHWAPVPDLLSYWVAFNQCAPLPLVAAVPDLDPNDGCTAEHLVWGEGRNGSAVELFRIIGGGHTWPTSPYLFGVTNRDIKASVEIWRFLRRYRLNELTAAAPSVLNIWPNSVDRQNLVNVRAGTALRPADVQVFDDMGRRLAVQAQLRFSGSLALDTHALLPGVYLLRVTADNTVYKQKLVK